MDQNEAIAKVKQFAALLPDYLHCEGVYLFGSFASGLQKTDSDIDVAIVINEVGDDYFTMIPLLWKLRRQIDERIEPILLERQHDPAGFLQIVQQTGLRVA
jgi:predicted nucleotidyltransferase